MEWGPDASPYFECDAPTVGMSFRVVRASGGNALCYAKQGGWRPEWRSPAPFSRWPKPPAQKGDERASFLRSRKTASSKWMTSVPAPLDPVHPVRLWTSAAGAKRGVWAADWNGPVSVCWLPRSRERSLDYDGAGSVPVLPALISHWRGKPGRCPSCPTTKAGFMGRSPRACWPVAGRFLLRTWRGGGAGASGARPASLGTISLALSRRPKRMRSLSGRRASYIFSEEDPVGNQAAEIFSVNMRKGGGSAALVPLPDSCGDPAEAARAFAEREAWT